VASLALGDPQELLDDEAAEAVADEDERRFAKLRLGQEPHQHAGRAVGEMHGAAAPARHRRLVADEVDAEPLGVLSERPRPEPFAVGNAAPGLVDDSAEAMHEDHVRAHGLRRSHDVSQLDHARPDSTPRNASSNQKCSRKTRR
jgi:hypothetical protein